jgi:hypothetical protein
MKKPEQGPVNKKIIISGVGMLNPSAIQPPVPGIPNISGISLAFAGKSNAMIVITENTKSMMNAVITRPLSNSLADMLFDPFYFWTGRLPDIKSYTAYNQCNHDQRPGPEQEFIAPQLVGLVIGILRDWTQYYTNHKWRSGPAIFLQKICKHTQDK